MASEYRVEIVVPTSDSFADQSRLAAGLLDAGLDAVRAAVETAGGSVTDYVARVSPSKGKPKPRKPTAALPVKPIPTADAA